MKLDYAPCNNISDEQQNAEARAALLAIKDHPVKAPRGKAIVWFAPFRREGLIDIPDMDRPNSVEAVIVHDNTAYQLPNGIKVMCHPKAGYYWEHHGVKLCTIEQGDMICVEESAA